jgi:hypothetical protein
MRNDGQLAACYSSISGEAEPSKSLALFFSPMLTESRLENERSAPPNMSVIWLFINALDF